MGVTAIDEAFAGVREISRAVFFGRALRPECQRCGAHSVTSQGFRYCEHTHCPVALREVQRRRQKRTSTLERVHIKENRVQSGCNPTDASQER